MVQVKACPIYEDMSVGDDNVKQFDASTGLFSRFTKRYSFHNFQMTGEPACSDTVAVIHYKGWSCQSPNPRKYSFFIGTFVFDLHDVFQECNPGI